MTESKIQEINAELERTTETLQYEAWQLFLSRFEKCNNGNHTRMLCKLFRKSRGRDEHGRLDGETSEDEKCEVCVAKWKHIYKPHPSDKKNRTFHNETEAWRNAFREREDKKIHSIDSCNRDFSMHELRNMIDKASPCKSSGDDGVHLNMLEKSKKLHELWLATFNTSHRWGTRDGSRKAAIFCLIPKANKELNTPPNGRTISLLQTASKMEDKLAEQRWNVSAIELPMPSANISMHS
eukprot:jgi/Bigna1/132805/aug1.19_g7513